MKKTHKIISIKTFFLLIISILTIAIGIGSYYLHTLHTTMIDERKLSVKNIVEVAYSQIEAIKKSKTTLTRSERQKIAMENLRSLRYGNNNYVWINDRSTPYPYMLMHPMMSSLEGKILDNSIFNCAETLQYGTQSQSITTDGKLNLFLAFHKVTENSQEGYVTYKWTKPLPQGGVSTERYLKVSYVKKIDDWDWVIGSGAYLDDVEEAYHNIAMYILLAMILFVIILAIISALFIKMHIRIRFYNQELEQQVQEELQKNRQKDFMLIQQSRLAAMGEMIGNIAHQWRQPLNTVGVLVQDIRDAYSYGECTADYFQEFENKTMQEITKMSQMIDELRSFFDSSQEEEIFMLSDVLTRVINLVKPALDEIGINFLVKGEGNEHLRGAKNELSQVLINILRNGEDILISRKIAKPTLSLSVQTLQNKVCITIEDNGGGIDEKIFPKIFDPYFTTKHQAQGAGLGLYMAKMIIEQHFLGTMYAKNTPTGACFVIELHKK